MDENDFLKAFSGIDLLQVEAIAKVIGQVVAKLREGMIEAGMDEFTADRLIVDAWRAFLLAMNTMYAPPGGQP